MALFGKKDESKETAPETEVPETQAPATEAEAGAEKKPETPEEKRERESVKMLITYYPDSKQTQVENVQNLDRRIALEMVERVYRSYNNEEIANVTVMKLIDTISKQQKGGKIWVPGAK